jgi:hypothetical protein
VVKIFVRGHIDVMKKYNKIAFLWVILALFAKEILVIIKETGLGVMHGVEG